MVEIKEFTEAKELGLHWLINKAKPGERVGEITTWITTLRIFQICYRGSWRRTNQRSLFGRHVQPCSTSARKKTNRSPKIKQNKKCCVAFSLHAKRAQQLPGRSERGWGGTDEARERVTLTNTPGMPAMFFLPLTGWLTPGWSIFQRLHSLTSFYFTAAFPSPLWGGVSPAGLEARLFQRTQLSRWMCGSL